ncbi:MAG TPA: right-handed parallel beta-helix repeat-containing protein [Armatimonadota bacterium]|nr:right-handed parallel beta-helix repeat-containing protein [Armatimonadota bacterium]
MDNRPCSLFLAFFFLFCVLLPTRAGIIYVNGNGATPPYTGQSWDHAFINIQDGINAAVADDEVWVAYGHYIERITLKNSVRVYGGFAGVETSRAQRPPFPRVSPDPYETRIDANKAGGTVTANNIIGAVLDGFTVEGANSSGGIVMSSSSTTITNCHITGNQGAGIIGGGNGPDRKPLVTANTIDYNYIGIQACYYGAITGNTISHNDGDGLLTCYYAAVTGNTISHNNGDGLKSCSPATISTNSISHNVSDGMQLCDNAVGSGNTISFNGQYGINSCAGAVLTSTVISDNTLGATYGRLSLISCLVTRNGGGLLSFNADGVAKVVNCTIAANTGDGLAFTGNGIFINNIIAFNKRGLVRTSGATLPSFSYNDVYGNITDTTAYDYVGLADQTGNAGNIKEDPLFANRASGDFHLTGGPCVNTGDNNAVNTGDVDLDNAPRIQNGIVDMGCYETGNVTLPLSLFFSVQPGGGTAPVRLNPQPVVRVQDATGALVSHTGSITLSIKTGTGPAGATLLGTTTMPIINGRAVFWNLAVNKPGAGYVLTAVSDGLPSVDSQPFSTAANPWCDLNRDGLFTLADITYALRVWAGLDQPT